MAEVHAHDLLNLINEQDQALSVKELSSLAKSTFGADTTYYACVGNGLNFHDILQILVQKGKIEIADGKLTRGIPCTH